MLGEGLRSCACYPEQQANMQEHRVNRSHTDAVPCLQHKLTLVLDTPLEGDFLIAEKPAEGVL
jgi:hypothetical protein